MYKPTIGLEIHIELNTRSKMFCSCRNDAAEKEPNKNICPICTAQPGVLPAINKEAVRKVVKTGLALNCGINKTTFFERKNYFYPDLPKNYQISQYALPLCGKGELNVNGKKIKIERVHLEEDTGRLVHPEGADYSLIDYNRAGIPLMELVTEPDIESAKEARDFIKELQLILRYLGVSEADMEKGEMRCEVNVSIKIQNPKTKNQKLGTKVEIKNLNSLRAVERGVEYEIKRQSEILGKGGKVIQETRGWHGQKERTFSQREKEESHDYRYFPEPDLPPLEINESEITKIKAQIPELPEARTKRFIKEYGLGEKEASLYVFQKELGDYFEKVVSELENWLKEKKQKESSEEEIKKIIKIASNYISTDLQALLKEERFQEKKFKISAENFAEFVSMIYLGEISSKIAKTILGIMFETGQDPSQIMEEKELRPMTDESELKIIAEKVILENEKAVADYKQGKTAAIQFLVGKVMEKTGGMATPEKTIEILTEMLNGKNSKHQAPNNK